MGGILQHARRRHIVHAALALAYALLLAQEVGAADLSGNAVTVTRSRHVHRLPVVPSPVLPGAPIPWSGSPVLTPPTLSIVDGQTRFLAVGPAKDRCPGDRIVFIPGVVNAFRPTLPGDGAFMCHGDAVMEGFMGQ